MNNTTQPRKEIAIAIVNKAVYATRPLGGSSVIDESVEKDFSYYLLGNVFGFTACEIANMFGCHFSNVVDGVGINYDLFSIRIESATSYIKGLVEKLTGEDFHIEKAPEYDVQAEARASVSMQNLANRSRRGSYD